MRVEIAPETLQRWARHKQGKSLLLAIWSLLGEDGWTQSLTKKEIGAVAGITHGQVLAQAFQAVEGEIEVSGVGSFRRRYRLKDVNVISAPENGQLAEKASDDHKPVDRSDSDLHGARNEGAPKLPNDQEYVDRSDSDLSTPVCMSDSESLPDPEDIQTDSARPTPATTDPWAARRTLALLDAARVKPSGDVPTEQERRAAAKALLTRFGMARSVADETAANHMPDYLEAHIDHYLFMLHARRLVNGRLPGVAWLIKHLAEDYGTPAGYTPTWRWPEETPAAVEDVQDPDVTEADLSSPAGPAGLLPDAAWAAAVERLRAERMETAAWLSDAAVTDVDGATFVVCVRNAYVREMVEQRCYRSLRRLLAAAWGAAVEVRFVVYVPAVDGQSGEFVAAGEAAR